MSNGFVHSTSFSIAKFLESYGIVVEISRIDETTFVDQLCPRIFVDLDGTTSTESTTNNNRSPKSLFREFLDLDGDGILKSDAEQRRFEDWTKSIWTRRRKSALIVVDVQNDFIEGTLSIRQCPNRDRDPADIIEPINRLVSSIPFDLVVYTYDWHPHDHISFVESLPNRQHILPDSSPTIDRVKIGDTVQFVIKNASAVDDHQEIRIDQKIWPRHCVRDSWGAELDGKLRIVDDAQRRLFIYKGQNPDVDSYSAFFDNQRRSATPLDRELRQRSITDVYVCGLAYDVCVAWTAEDALELGYNAAIVDDCCAGLNTSDIDRVKRTIRAHRNGTIVRSEGDVEDLIKGKRVPWNWAYAMAIEIFTKG